VSVDGQLVSTIKRGILVFAAIAKDDTVKEAESMAAKVLKVKLWNDDEGGKWKRNVQEIEGEVLCGELVPRQLSATTAVQMLIPSLTVSQFTLLASTKKGNKPSFHESATPDKGKELYDAFVGQVRKLYQEDRVKDGVFQAMMDVSLVNDGPVGIDYRCIDEAVNAVLMA
jgi:D-tyrosyl-tRNA(Tyr) deacylase